MEEEAEDRIAQDPRSSRSEGQARGEEEREEGLLVQREEPGQGATCRNQIEAIGGSSEVVVAVLVGILEERLG